ncbi:MAG: IclR family transcriptional regulator [Acidobacteria bacterium]|nr:IclR family transcriptional regulator [Acidobacteriota bacterium]MBK8810613.1 IclR family transcriptional regulator [Acidobacteriota bacterium]
MLELVAESGNGLSNSDLSRRLKIPRSSASYILRVLEKRDYLRRDAGGRYRLGLKLMSLTGGAVFHMDVREAAKPILADFLKKSRLPEVHLAVLDNGRAVYIEKLESETSFIKMDIWVGHRLPVHTTAIGKVLVSYLPDDQILGILEERGMERKTKRSITSPTKFLREAARVRQYGFAVDNEENSESVRCIAAPIFDANGAVLAALGTSAVVLHISEEQLPKIVQLVKMAAAKLSAQMGFIG